MRRLFRKPLIAVTSKKLLRYKDAYSKLSEIAEGTRFNRVYPEMYPTELVPEEDIKKVVLCSG